MNSPTITAVSLKASKSHRRNDDTDGGFDVWLKFVLWRELGDGGSRKDANNFSGEARKPCLSVAGMPKAWPAIALQDVANLSGDDTELFTKSIFLIDRIRRYLIHKS